MGNFGPLELGIILVIVLVIFGPKRLPSLGKQLGSGMREFKDGITGNSKDDDDDEGVAALTAAASNSQPVAEPAKAAPVEPAPVERPSTGTPQS